MIIDSFPGHTRVSASLPVGEAHAAHQDAIVLVSDRTPLYIAGRFVGRTLRKQGESGGIPDLEDFVVGR